MLFCELRVEIDLRNKFLHIAKGIPVKLSECEQSSRLRFRSGIKGEDLSNYKPLKTHQINISLQLALTKFPSKNFALISGNVKPTFSVLEMKQAFGGMIQTVDLQLRNQYIEMERNLFELMEYR